MSSKATIANPAISPARNVMPATESARVTDTPTSTLPVDPDPDGAPPARNETAREAAARAGLQVPKRAHAWWAITLTALSLVLLSAIALASILPSGWFAKKENARLGVKQPAEYARAPATAQPVADLVRVGDLGDKATQYPPKGDIYFVTVMSPPQSLLSWLVGRREPAIQFLTAEDVNGVRTPTQRRTLDLASMRTSGYSTTAGAATLSASRFWMP